jgi:two-component system, NtrC family, sensor kinase
VVSVHTRCTQGQVTITVSDNGCGMSEAVQARLFEPFFTTKDVGRGTGQGLVIARAAAIKHGGALTLESAPGVGTRFTLSIPIESTDSPTESESNTSLSETSSPGP